MAYQAYKVGADGKAPKGLQADDYVVTAGGTYRITGVNGDGSYQSERISNVTTDTYTGKYATAPVQSAPAAQEPETRSEDVKPYYPRPQATGTAGGMAESAPLPSSAPAGHLPPGEGNGVAAPASGVVGAEQRAAEGGGPYNGAAQQAPAVVDLTPFLRQQAAARIEAELAGLKSAYERSLSGLQADMEALPEQYEAARRNAAAQDVLARKAFQEQAAATGLNTGAAGQAELSQSAVYRNILAGIDNEEASAGNALRRQMADLGAQYRAASAQAQASGNVDLASALYEELLRQDTQRRADADAALDREYQERLLRYNQEQDALDRAAQQEQAARDRVESWLTMGGSAAELPAELLNAAGYTAPELSLMEQYIAAMAARDAEAEAAAALTWPQIEAQIKAGNLTPGVLAGYERFMGVPYAAPEPEPEPESEPVATVSGYVPVADLNRPAPEYGTSYNIAANKVASMLREGRGAAEVYSYLDSFSTAGLTDAGLAKILVDYGLTGG